MPSDLGLAHRGLIAGVVLASGFVVYTASAPAAAPVEPREPGNAIYAAHCSGCHGEHLQGGQFGPPLRGAGFAATWTARRDALVTYVSERMPPNAAGTLSADAYAAVVDHIIEVDRQSVGRRSAAPAPGPHPPGEKAFRDAAFDGEMGRQAALLAALSPVTSEMLRSPPANDWLTWRRTQDASGFSPLRQIHRGNVSRLRLIWSWSASHGRNEIAPLVHDGVMFINSGPEVQALDAATGTLLWRYVRPIPPEYRGPLNMVQRSIAIHGRTVLVPTADRHLVALDVASGAPVWDVEVIPKDMPRAVLSAGPVVAGDVIVQGTSIGAMTPGGSFVVGIEADTGKMLWRFNSIAGDKSWNGTPLGERTGGAVWVAPTYDPDLDTVFYGTGGTYDLSRLLRPGAAGESSDALYTNATIALDPRTGTMRWHHQHMAREVWDLDEAFERLLATLPFEGRERQALVTVGKMGILDALERDTGRYLFSIDLALNNIVTAIDATTGERRVDPAKVPKSNRSVEICPSVQGARNWMATAYNPKSRTLFLPLQNLCMDYVWSDLGGDFDSTVDNGWMLKAGTGSGGLRGRIQAIDLGARRTRWVRNIRSVPSSSLLATDGGLIFAGMSDRMFRALDDRTGKTLWQARLASVASATPVTFSVDGAQYVAIVSGAGGDQATQIEQTTPEVMASVPATTIFVFGL